LILDDIAKALEEIDPIVFYGAVKRKKMQEKPWNYIVFNRTVLRNTGNNTGWADVYTVNIVREEFIPEGLAEEIIAKLEEIKGMTVVKSDSEYTYMVKPNSDDVVEMLSIDFKRVRKK
jgi:hypothetical protein